MNGETEAGQIERRAAGRRGAGQRLSPAASAAGIGLWERDLRAGASWCSAEWLRLFGVQAAPHFAEWLALIHPEDRARVERIAAKVIESEGDFACEYRVVQKDGAVRWVADRGRVVRDDAGRAERIVGVAIDITGRTLAESAAGAGEERFRAAFVHAAVGMAMTDRAGRFVQVNQAFCRMTGRSEKELMEAGAWAVVHPEDSRRLLEARRSVAAGASPATLELRYLHKTGEALWARLSLAALPAGTGAGFIGLLEDIQARKEVEERLEMQARVLSRLAEGVFVCDAAGVIRLTNPAFDAMCGYQAGELAGQHIGAVMRALPEETRGQLAGMRKQLDEHGVWTGEVRYVSKKGKAVTATVSVTWLDQGTSGYYVAVNQDITERKRMEDLARARAARIRELERQRGESEKLAAAGRMAARVAHEINNPLAGIKNSFLLVKDAIPPDYPYYSYVARIEKEIDRIAGIVHQMYELHRPDETAPRPLALNEVVADVIALLAPDARENEVVLSTHVPAPPVPVVLPEGPLRQVLFNVITNAIEAAPRASEVKVALAAAAGTAVIAVSDRGPGISEELRTRIFEPFFSTKTAARGKGLGLGLAISHGLVEAMGGSMDFENRAGGGTVFRIRLPLATAQ